MKFSTPFGHSEVSSRSTPLKPSRSVTDTMELMSVSLMKCRCIVDDRGNSNQLKSELSKTLNEASYKRPSQEEQIILEREVQCKPHFKGSRMAQVSAS